MADMQQLKKAEEDAKRQVDAARKDRAEHLKKKRAAAEAEVKAIREENMKKLEDLRAAGDNDQTVFSQMQANRDADIALLRSDVAQNKAKAVSILLDVVTSVSLEVPTARKGIKAK